MDSIRILIYIVVFLFGFVIGRWTMTLQVAFMKKRASEMRNSKKKDLKE